MTSSDGPQPYPRDVAYELPTPGQQEAVRLLDGQDVDDVFAYLKYARSSAGSSRRGEGSRGHGEGLLPEQVGAIKTLSGCADRKLRTWLRDARATSDTGAIDASQSSSTSALHYPVTHHASAVPVPLSGFKLSSEVLSHARPSAKHIERPHLYRCTICEEHRSYKNDSDWKKHEKEHEYTYKCTPDGWLGITGSGTECLICGVPDPDEQHAFEHNVQGCSFSCKRRDHMTKHLSKCHGVHDLVRGCTLAKNWLRGSGRRFWSCGLCVSLFPSLQERLKHLDVEHFRRHQSVDGWSVTNVIYGLLKQPGVREAWDAQMTAQHRWQHPEILWEASELGDLQLILEMGPSDERSAVSLANAAFDKCKTQNAYAWSETANPADDGHEAMDTEPVSSSSHYQSVSAHNSSTPPSAAESTPWEVQHPPIHSRSEGDYGFGQEPALCEPIIKEASFDQSADLVLFPGMENYDYADMEQWTEAFH